MAKSKPPKTDQVLQLLYDNGAIRGELVLTGQETMDQFPAIKGHEVHFRKTNLSDLSYLPGVEFDCLRTLMRECPGVGPMPFGKTQTKLLTEFVDGKSLLAMSPFRPVGQKQPPVSQTMLATLWAATESALTAAQSLHDEGWVHGDLHLDNVLITGTGTARIIDFESLRQPQDEEEFAEDKAQLLKFASRIIEAGFEAPRNEMSIAAMRVPGFQPFPAMPGYAPTSVGIPSRAMAFR